ncbi:MAG: hypothetical protein FWD49_05850 [Firmicutes bacterium]|nr:hypothetical protein [Bacillota bacterium]
MTITDREIKSASDVIDVALARIDKTNRGEIATSVLAVIRNLNDHIAYKLWCELEPNQNASIKNVAKNFINRPPFKYIGVLRLVFSNFKIHFEINF